MDRARSETGRRGLKAGQLGGAVGVFVSGLGGAFVARDFLGAGIITDGIPPC